MPVKARCNYSSRSTQTETNGASRLMKRLSVVYFILLSLFSISSKAASLVEITQFAVSICDDIIAEIGVTSSISKTTIEGKIDASLPKVAKLLGVKLSGNGKLLYDHQEVSGLSLEALPDQLSSARECRERLAIALIEERQKTCGVAQYQLKRSDNCPVEQHVLKASDKCAMQDHTFTAASGGCSACGSQCDNWGAGFGGGKHISCNEDEHSKLDGLKYKKWKSCAMHCQRRSECRHPAHGVETYQQCRHPAHGVETYKQCED